MNIRVKGPRVLVYPRPEQIEEHTDGLPDTINLGQTESGLHLAALAVDRRPPVTMGRVLQLGDNPICPHCHKGKAFDVQVGDVIAFAPSAGELFYVDDKRYLILNASDISAIVLPIKEPAYAN